MGQKRPSNGRLVKGSPITDQAIGANQEWLNRDVEGTIYHFLDEGAALLIKDGPLHFCIRMKRMEFLV